MKLAIVPARAGSKRIPQKNIVDISGKPMICHTIENIVASGQFDKVHVSTDSEEIISLTREIVGECDFQRDSSLADDYTPLIEVIPWVFNEFKKRGQTPSTIALIMPTAFLLPPEIYKEAMQTFAKREVDLPLISMAPYPCPTEWAFKKNSGHHVKAQQPDSLVMRSQDISPSYYDTGDFCLYSPEHLEFLSKGNHHDEYLMQEIPRELAVDVDTPEDLALARALFKVRNEK